MSFCAFFKIKLGEWNEKVRESGETITAYALIALFVGLIIGLPLLLITLGYISRDAGLWLGFGIFVGLGMLAFLLKQCLELFDEYEKFKEGPGDTEMDPRPTDETAPEIFLDDAPLIPFETHEPDTYNN